MPRLIRRHWEGIPGGYGRSARSFDYEAFVPDTLDALQVEYSASLVDGITQAELAIRDLEGSANIAGLESLSHQLLRAESVASSWIEGLQLSQRRLAQALFDADAADSAARAVMGNIEAMEEAVRLGAEARALRPDDVLSIHRRLLERTRDAAIAGRFREQQNWIGRDPGSPYRADFVPPPESEVPRLMADLCAFMNRTDAPAIAQAAVAHAQFETIHPFADGNGRVGRALIHVVLRRRSVVKDFVPPVSVVLAANVRRYVDGLTAFRQGKPSEWCEVFARSLRAAAVASVELGAQFLALQESWREAAGRPRRGSATDKLIGSLARRPILDINAAAGLVGVSYPQARNAVVNLETAGALKPVVVGRRRNRAWEAPAVIALLDDFEFGVTTPTRDGEPRRPSPKRRTE
jgi:Fic family protein